MLLVHQYMVKVLDLISFVYYVYKYDLNSLFQFLGIAKNNLLSSRYYQKCPYYKLQCLELGIHVNAIIII